MRTCQGARGAAAVVSLAASVMLAGPSAATPTREGQQHSPGRPSVREEAPTSSAAERLRAIVAIIDGTRARAAAPGLSDEERDALAELAWAQADEALGDSRLGEVAQRDPDLLQVHALLLMDDGEDEAAFGVLERLAVIAPGDPETHRLLALALAGLGREAAAVEEYRRALALGVEPAAEVRAHLAYSLAAAGRLEEGLAESARAISQDPSFYLGHFVRGWILGQAGRRDEERREYLAALELDRDDADLWAMLARSFERTGESARAEEAWREVARIDPSDGEAAAKIAAQP